MHHTNPARLWIALALALATGAPLTAQETPQIAEIEIDGGKDEPAAKRISLRPNTPIGLGFELRNKTPDTLRDVVVRIVQVTDGGEERVIAEKTLKEIPPTPAAGKGVFAVDFEKVKGADKAPPPEKGEKKPSDKHELRGPPFQLQVHVEARQPKDFPITKRKFELVVRQPRDYAGSSATFDALAKRLTVNVAYPKQEDVFGPPRYPLELSFSPGLKVDKKGLFTDSIKGPRDVGTLSADFEQQAGEGEAYVKIDGYERAYTYPVKLAAGGAINALPREEIRMRINVPRYAKPTPQFDVLLEADGPLSDVYQINVDIAKSGEKNQFRDEQSRTGLRSQQASLSVVGKQLACEVAVTDWRFTFDTKGIYKTVWFRVNVTKKVGKDVEKVKLSYPRGSRAHLSPIEADEDSKNLYVAVGLDDTPPKGLQYVNLPKEWSSTAPLEVKVTLAERLATQAPIEKVMFLKGRPPKDDKDLKDDDIYVTIDSPDPKRTDFSFVLPAQNKLDPVVLSTMVVTSTGIKSAITESINITPGAGAKNLFKIRGKVVHGDLPQPKLPVALFNVKGKEKIPGTMTDDGGNYVFFDVPPGVYVVTSEFGFRKLEGRAEVEVRDADRNGIVISLGPKKGK